MRIECPRCRSKATIRTSKAMSESYRQLYCACTDTECGHTFVMDLTFSHTLSPSALDLPEKVRLDIRGKSQPEMLTLFSSLA